MKQVLLEHSLHRAEVPVAKVEQADLPLLLVLRPDIARLETPLLAQRQREHLRITVLRLKEFLVVGMPADGVRAILIQVHVAAVGPLALI